VLCFWIKTTVLVVMILVDNDSVGNTSKEKQMLDKGI
jgi:hypothetical protein